MYTECPKGPGLQDSAVICIDMNKYFWKKIPQNDCLYFLKSFSITHGVPQKRDTYSLRFI